MVGDGCSRRGCNGSAIAHRRSSRQPREPKGEPPKWLEMKIPGPHTRSTKAMSSEAHTKRVLKRVGGNSNSKASRRTAPNRIVMSESRTTAALRRCEWPANRGRTGEPLLRCRWRRHGSARIGADAEVGSVRRAKFPRNLPVPCRLSDVYGPRQTGMGAIVMERATAKMRALQRLSHRQARSSLAVVRELQLARRLNLEST